MRPLFFLFQAKNDRRSERGLTLVEILITVTIFAIVSVGISALFLSGMTLWTRIGGVDFARSERILDLELIARDLRQSLNLPAIGFEGTANTFSFPAVDGGEVVRVTYAVDAGAGQVKRRVGLFSEILAGHTDSFVREETALTAQKIVFKYYYADDSGSSWLEVWPKDKGTFRAIRVEGESQGEPFVKTIIIPVV